MTFGIFIGQLLVLLILLVLSIENLRRLKRDRRLADLRKYQTILLHAEGAVSLLTIISWLMARTWLLATGILLTIMAGGILTGVTAAQIKRKHRFLLAAHQRFPEVLDWQKDDEFDTSKWRYKRIRFIAIDAAGWVYCATDDATYPLTWFSVEELAGTNRSARERKIRSWIQGSTSYTEELREIQAAKSELEDRKVGSDGFTKG